MITNNTNVIQLLYYVDLFQELHLIIVIYIPYNIPYQIHIYYLIRSGMIHGSHER